MAKRALTSVAATNVSLNAGGRPYRVTVRQEGQPDRVITGTARQGQRDQVVGEFTVP